LIEGERAFTASSPRVTAIGKGSPRCEWYFQNTGAPLVGDQSMFQLLLAPLHLAELSMWLRAGITTKGRLPGLPVTRHTGWTEVAAKCRIFVQEIAITLYLAHRRRGWPIRGGWVIGVCWATEAAG
jgi:hypothetical protein